MNNKVKFYQYLGGRKAFIALLFFVVSLILFLLQGLLDFNIQFSELSNFWKWDAGIFASGNVGTKCANAVKEWIKNKDKKRKQQTNAKDSS